MIKFKYTKASGETTDRVAIVLTSPQKNFAMLDLTDFSAEELKAISKNYQEYQEALKQARWELEKKFGLEAAMNQYKAFKPEGIKDVEQV